MTPRKTPIPDSLAFDADKFARAWIVASIAQSDDAARPTLASVQVEQFANGLRLVATDSYMIVRAWASMKDKPEPNLKARPLRTFTAADPDKRAAALMRWALNSRVESVAVDFTVDVLRLTVGNETISLLKAIGNPQTPDYPDWRALWNDNQPGPTDRVAINPHLMFPRLQKIQKLVGEDTDPIIFDFGGSSQKPVRWRVGNQPNVNGLLMPVRISEGS